MTNKGLRIPLRIIPSQDPSGQCTGLLACYIEETLQPIGIAFEANPYTEGAVFFRDASVAFITDFKRTHIPQVFTEICVAKTETMEPLTNLYTRIRVAEERKFYLEKIAIYTDRLYAYDEKKTIRLPDKHHTVTVACSIKASMRFFVTYGIIGSDPYSTFIDINPESFHTSTPPKAHNTNMMLALKEGRVTASRKTTITYPNCCKIVALLSWVKILDEDVLMADIWVHRTWWEIFAERGFRRIVTDVPESYFILLMALSVVYLNSVVFVRHANSTALLLSIPV
jgi:hypothetical protein